MVDKNVKKPKDLIKAEPINSTRPKRKEKGTTANVEVNLNTEAFNLFNVTDSTLDRVHEFFDLKSEERVKASREVIQRSIIDLTEEPDARFIMAVDESETLLEGYATLDDQHRTDIQNLQKQITDYLQDATRKRPLNALMLASPGAGKSHFIKQLADSMRKENVEAVTFNMATMQSADDIAQPIDELRNLKVNDKFPLLFLDEFDSDPGRFATLLPLLWDGELQIGHRDLKLGKAVIVLAGSSPTLPKTMDQSAKMRLEPDGEETTVASGKLLDLLSRINGGVINIPDLDARSDIRDRRIDKVCIAVSLLKARFGDDLKQVPRTLLRFIAHTKFRYGVRSIAHLINEIDSKTVKTKIITSQSLALPFNDEKVLSKSSLSLHLLDSDEAFGIVNRWKEFSKEKVNVDLGKFPFMSLFRSLNLKRINVSKPVSRKRTKK